MKTERAIKRLFKNTYNYYSKNKEELDNFLNYNWDKEEEFIQSKVTKALSEEEKEERDKALLEMFKAQVVIGLLNGGVEFDGSKDEKKLVKNIALVMSITEELKKLIELLEKKADFSFVKCVKKCSND